MNPSSDKGNRYVVRTLAVPPTTLDSLVTRVYAIRRDFREKIYMLALAKIPYSVTIIPPAARLRERTAGRDWRAL